MFLSFFTLLFCLIDVPQDPNRSWAHEPKAPQRMRDGFNPLTHQRQSFYFPDNHDKYPKYFKGMEQIIRERGLWPEGGLPVECSGPKRPQGQANCCCRHLLYTQPDFASQKPLLQEHIESRGHLCDFYPKYHCELNFIEQYWGAAKFRFRTAGRARTLGDMEGVMLSCLDAIPLEQIRRCAIFSFVSKTKILLQICGQVRAFYFRISSRVVGCSSSMGKQEIPWPSHSSPRYGRTGEGNSPGVNIFIRYIYYMYALLMHMGCAAPAPSNADAFQYE